MIFLESKIIPSRLKIEFVKFFLPAKVKRFPVDLFVKKNGNVGRCYVSRVWKCSIWTEKIFALCPLTLSHMYRL